MPHHTFIVGDVREALATLAGASIDACVTDPPYHLTAPRRNGPPRQFMNNPYGRHRVGTHGFMGEEWDGGDVAFRTDVWSAVKRVLKPGAHLVAFGGTRTYHRLACAVEDAGFEVRDMLEWLYGSGFPKSHNLEGEWEGWGTALKPAHEPVILARRPLSEKNVAANVSKWGTGALNIDAARLGPGRWPPNVALDVTAASMLDDQTGEHPSGSAHVLRRGATTGAGMGYGSSAPGNVLNATYGDSGGASRFFYVAKADVAERGPGNDHPTVKPVALMEWLTSLVTPPEGTVLDCFGGSGTTVIAAKRLGRSSVYIDLNPAYADMALRRCDFDQQTLHVHHTHEVVRLAREEVAR